MKPGCASSLVVFIIIALAASLLLGVTQASQPASKTTKRAIPVTNVVPAGAAEFKGTLIKLEVIEALDVRRSEGGWRTRLAVRYKNVRADRVRCTLTVYFDDKLFDTIHNIDLPARETDLTVISASGGEGKRAGQLSKFTATVSDIRVGG